MKSGLRRLATKAGGGGGGGRGGEEEKRSIEARDDPRA